MSGAAPAESSGSWRGAELGALHGAVVVKAALGAGMGSGAPAGRSEFAVAQDDAVGPFAALGAAVGEVFADAVRAKLGDCDLELSLPGGVGGAAGRWF